MKKICQKNLPNLLSYMIPTLIGLILLCLIALLCGCTSHANHVNRQPITCMEHIKTNQDLVNCLVEYDEKY